LTTKFIGVLQLEPTLGTPHRRGRSTLDLTQDIILQPACHIVDGLLHKADQIFEKEQGYLLEAASKKLQREPTLYVNDHGYFYLVFPVHFLGTEIRTQIAS